MDVDLPLTGNKISPAFALQMLTATALCVVDKDAGPIGTKAKDYPCFSIPSCIAAVRDNKTQRVAMFRVHRVHHFK